VLTSFSKVVFEVSRDRIASFEYLIKEATNTTGDLTPTEAALLARIVDEVWFNLTIYY